jgi:hypothetical protein
MAGGTVLIDRFEISGVGLRRTLLAVPAVTVVKDMHQRTEQDQQKRQKAEQVLAMLNEEEIGRYGSDDPEGDPGTTVRRAAVGVVIRVHVHDLRRSRSVQF